MKSLPRCDSQRKVERALGSDGSDGFSLGMADDASIAFGIGSELDPGVSDIFVRIFTKTLLSNIYLSSVFQFEIFI